MTEQLFRSNKKEKEITIMARIKLLELEETTGAERERYEELTMKKELTI